MPSDIAPHFSPEEVEQIGLVEESAVDWDGKVDIDLGDDAADSGPESQAAAIRQPADRSTSTWARHRPRASPTAEPAEPRTARS